MALSDYLTDTAELLHDVNYQFTSKTQLTRWINESRRQVCLRTGCIRLLISGASAFGASSQPGFLIPGGAQPGALPGAAPSSSQSQANNTFQTIPNVERYPYGFAVPYLTSAYDGVDGINDVYDVAVSWGGVRPAMAWLPWSDLQAYARSFNVGVFSYPFYWSTMGDGQNSEVWLFPVPQTYCEMEWQVFASPSPLIDDSSPEAIPHPFRNAVKYYAAHLAYFSTQRFGMASMMLEHFKEQLPVSRAASESSRVSDYYYNVP